MIRLICLFVLAAITTAAYAQQGPGAGAGSKGPANGQKLEACKQLARQRGFGSSMENAKGGNGPRAFIAACMHGKVS